MIYFLLDSFVSYQAPKQKPEFWDSFSVLKQISVMKYNNII